MANMPLLTRTIDITAIPAGGQAYHIGTSQAAREAIAAAFGLVAVNRLVADLEVSRGAGRMVIVEGRVEAEIVQTCIVSLEPVVQVIDEPVRDSFIEAGAPGAPTATRPGAEVHVDPEEDAPEVLAGTELDLGAIALGHVALAIDPYPRAPGAQLPAGPDDTGNGERASPFAVLAKLAGKE